MEEDGLLNRLVTFPSESANGLKDACRSFISQGGRGNDQIYKVMLPLGFACTIGLREGPLQTAISVSDVGREVDLSKAFDDGALW